MDHLCSRAPWQIAQDFAKFIGFPFSIQFFLLLSFMTVSPINYLYFPTALQFSASQRTQLIYLYPAADTKTEHSSSSESIPYDSIHICQCLICRLRFTQHAHVKYLLRFKLELPPNEKCSTQLCVLSVIMLGYFRFMKFGFIFKV